ncbi:MAG: TolB family protein [Lachnospiraceae bacterium]|nr:TolB family protein [Lachnospiraceae bacterium]
MAAGKRISYLKELDINTGEVRLLHTFERLIEAPNRLKTNGHILFNSEGKIWDLDPEKDTVTLIESGLCDNCNNDHVPSPDESMIAVSHGVREEGFSSYIYVLPIRGGEPKRITPGSPSFLHGWSPDGKELAYCAFREHEGKTEVDIYTIPVAERYEDLSEGRETRLTSGGFNDGPEYSPNGKYIWFNSTRSGLMQIWRMERDGKNPTQMTFSERNNWFAHVSPDGKKVVYLSYSKEDLKPEEHLPDLNVELHIMNADGSDQRKLLSLFGGQGTINVNSWDKDSTKIAFVSYEPV